MPNISELNEEPQEQLSLFELATNSQYSNAIIFYDLMPKYDYTKNRYLEINEDNSQASRQWDFKDNKYSITIKPASVVRKSKDKETKQFVFPSAREEIVEDAIRKLATSGNGTMLDDFAACVFTLYELRQELSRVGHTYSISEIKEAIQVLSDSSMKVTDEFGKSVINSPFIASFGLTSSQELKANRDAKCFVLFNVYVTKSIKALEFRQINYEKQMNFKTSLARSIFKRLSNLWVQASQTNHYGPVSIWTIFKNAGITPNSRMSECRNMVARALDELEALNIIEHFDEAVFNKEGKKVFSKRGTKIYDVKYTLYAHEDFIKDQKRINHFGKKLRSIKATKEL